MMKTIWKFPIQITGGEQTILVPRSSHLLSVGLDPNDELHVWFEVHTTKPKDTAVKFWLAGTGNPLDPDIASGFCQFLATVKQGRFMWHIYWDGSTSKA